MTKVKKFNRYMIRTFKEGRYLLLKYIVSALLMIVIAVMSNLLGVEELTYLNAVINVDYIVQILGFGIFEGVNVLANQNINSKFRVRKYSQIGFQLAIIVGLIFSILLAIFPNFIMVTITSFVPTDYTFYYIMCGYAFLSCIKEYLTNLLKSLEVFKAQFFCDILITCITIVGFMVLYFAGIYYLNYIAIAYLVGIIIGIVFCFYFLMRNKKVKVNLFHRQPISLTKKQWGIMVANVGTELIWVVGYFATSIFLLRLGDEFLNTYSYLETVLDVFNGFLFTYINITCIKITRNLGRSNFKKVLEHSRYSIYGVFVIWFFYAVASMIFIYPVALGANDAYFDLMFLVTPCYVLINLVRFLRWNFSSYMLRLGGKNKPIVIAEVFYALMYIALCFVAKFVPDNMFVMYALVALPELTILVVDWVIYKRRNWMANINDDPSSLKNKVKCFIFDFDDTLYYGVDWTIWKKFATNYFNEHFSYLTEKQRSYYLKKYKCGKNGEEVLAYIEKISIEIEGTCQPWLDFSKGVIEPEAKDGKAIPMREIKKCAQQGKIYIVSNTKMEMIEKFARIYKIDLSLFERVISNEFTPGNEGKERYYKEIMEENGLQPDQILVIGNSKREDILPAEKLKMNTYLADGQFTYEELIG